MADSDTKQIPLGSSHLSLASRKGSGSRIANQGSHTSNNQDRDMSSEEVHGGDDDVDDKDDYTSSSGSSSSGDEEDEDSPTDTRPSAISSRTPIPASSSLSASQTQRRQREAIDLKARLSTFLPQLRQANASLEDAGDLLLHRLDDVGDDEEHYIEMDLALGVLRERAPGEVAMGMGMVEGESSDDDDGGGGGGGRRDHNRNIDEDGGDEKDVAGKDEDILSKLKGKSRTGEKQNTGTAKRRKIEEID